MKTFTVLLMLSQGVPMICAGDEFGRTQKGNNNAWCQDNQISWLDWSLLETNKNFHRFYRHCIMLRKQHAIFRREKFFPPESSSPGTNLSPEIAWQYLTPNSQNWSSDCHGLAFLLRAAANDQSSSDFFVALNGSKDTTLYFKAPEPLQKGRAWYRIIDTSTNAPQDIVSLVDAMPHLAKNSIGVPPFGCVVLQSDF
jgi:glycogen operon protein